MDFTSEEEQVMTVELMAIRLLYRLRLKEGTVINEYTQARVMAMVNQSADLADSFYQRCRFMSVDEANNGDDADLLAFMALVSSIEEDGSREGSHAVSLHANLVIYAKGYMDGKNAANILHGQVSSL